METVKQINATKQNIEKAIKSIEQYALAKGYQITGNTNLVIPDNIIFESKSKEKVLRKYLWKVTTYPTMDQSNRFFHFLCKKILKLTESPKVQFSEKELAIKMAKLSWKKAKAESDRLLLEYKKEKGDFYKK